MSCFLGAVLHRWPLRAAAVGPGHRDLCAAAQARGLWVDTPWWLFVCIMFVVH